MRSGTAFSVFGLAALTLNGVSATGGWRGQSAYSCPENIPNECTSQESSGFDWSDLDDGEVSNYNDYNFSGWSCGSKPTKRSLEGRTFNSKCISSDVQKGDFSNSISCDKKDFSVGDMDISTDDGEDQEVEFHYEMPDSSTCVQRATCGSSGSTVKNDQCGGAKSVKVKLPDNSNKEKCGVNIHSVNFHCGTSTTSIPVPTTTLPTEVSSIPVPTTTSEASCECEEGDSACSSAMPSSCAPATTSPPTTSSPAECEECSEGDEACSSALPASCVPATSVPASSVPVTTSAAGSCEECAEDDAACSSALPASCLPATTSPGSSVPTSDVPVTTSPAGSCECSEGDEACSSAMPSSCSPATTSPVSSVPASSVPASSVPSGSCEECAEGDEACSSAMPSGCSPATTAPGSSVPASSAPASSVPSGSCEECAEGDEACSSAMPSGCSPATSNPGSSVPVTSSPATTSQASGCDCSEGDYACSSAMPVGCSGSPSTVKATESSPVPTSSIPADCICPSGATCSLPAHCLPSYPSTSVPGQGTIPATSGSVPSQSGSVPSQSGSVPSQSGSIPSGSGSVPSGSGSVPSGSGSVPSGSGSVPSGSGSVPSGSGSVPSGSGSVPSGSSTSGIFNNGTSPSSTGSSPQPSISMPSTSCPDVVPKCLNTWMWLLECADNANAACYCPDSKFVEKVSGCLQAWSKDTEELTSAVEYFLGICQPHIPENPAIVSAIPTYITMTPAPSGIPVQTITQTITTVVPCEPTTIMTGESSGSVVSSSTSILATAITIPQVTLVVTASDADLQYPQPTGAQSTLAPTSVATEIPASVPAGATTFSTAVPAPSGGYSSGAGNGTVANGTQPQEPQQTQFTGGSGRLSMTFSLMGLGMLAVFVL